MSEYQYYEFQVIDKPLNEKSLEALRDLSSRAHITSTSFVNTYNYGDFRGNPLKLMEKYFDAFLYVANWGTHWFMLRAPCKLLNGDLIKKYCMGDSATIHKKSEHLIFEFTSETENHEWEEGEGWLSSLISLRSDIIYGDYRCLYLAWLFCAQSGEIDDDDLEPPVPPNLGNLNAPLKSFVDFMRIDTDLIAVAAENSAAKKKTKKDDEVLKNWIRSLSANEKNEIIFRLVNDNDPYLGTELAQEFQKSMTADDIHTKGKKPRTVSELLQKAEAYAEERKRRIAEQKEKERIQREREAAIGREKYLNDLSKREDAVWEKVDILIETKKQKEYDEAVQLLVDLRDLAKKSGKISTFNNRLGNIHEKHIRKSSFIRRLREKHLNM